ncbi:MAG: hypothetical protein U0441_37415 [Polyangiaceae bacterium]
MEIVADALVPYPRPRVFAVYRDELAEMAEFLPNIRAIKVLKRVDREGEVDLVNEWTGGGDIPSVARSVLSESMLRWTDYATWFANEFRVEWRTEIHAFPGAVASSGTNRFYDTPEGTRLEVRGQFTIDAAKIPGVPRLLSKTIGSTVEKVMVTQIVKNTAETARGIAKLIARKSA